MNKNSNDTLHTQWHNDPFNWKLGFIYRNAKDKRLLVPKRWGLGFTLNFGNPLTVVLLLILFVVPVLIAFLIS
ncbi:MAG: hypothetical protein EOO01_18145 [Chitinophagaceae bacterium]|nr:MAG: hypothetical protein EOO01_18145 [Chitinophagaceae bacterium]